MFLFPKTKPENAGSAVRASEGDFILKQLYCFGDLTSVSSLLGCSPKFWRFVTKVTDLQNNDRMVNSDN